MRAVTHGGSMEAEIRHILESAVAPEGRVKRGSLLADIGREAGLTDDELGILEQARDPTPPRPVSSE